MQRCRSIAVVALGLMVGGGAALAQPAPAPPPTPGPEPAPAPAPSGALVRVAGEVGVFAAIPGDDIADSVDTSGGIRGAVSLAFTPNLSVHAAFRFIVVNVKDLDDDVDVRYFDFGLGGRFTLPLNPMLSGYGEIEFLGSSVRVSSGPFSVTDEDPGFAARVGALYRVGPQLQLSGFLGFTKNFAADDPDDTDSSWVDIGVGLRYQL